MINSSSSLAEMYTRGISETQLKINDVGKASVTGLGVHDEAEGIYESLQNLASVYNDRVQLDADNISEIAWRFDNLDIITADEIGNC